jgi:hypothetical protein
MLVTETEMNNVRGAFSQVATFFTGGNVSSNLAMPWLRSLVAGFSPRRPGFAPGSIHVGFVVDKVAVGQIFLRGLRFSLSIYMSCHRRSRNSYHLGNA